MISFLIEDNEAVRKFLEGDNSYIPASECKYLHEHPLLRPNFITQIEDLVTKVGNKIIKAKVTGKPIDDLSRHAITLGQNLDGVMDDEKASRIAYALRDLYQLCQGLDKNLK